MARVFRIANGMYAIWEGEYDDLPFTDPLDHLDRVIDHSLLDKVRIVDIKDFTLNIPAIAQGSTTEKSASYTLGAHGRAGQPWIIAELTISGHRIAITGSVPVQIQASTYHGDPYGRWIGIGVDATNIIVHEYAVQAGRGGSGLAAYFNGRAAQSFPIRVYISDIML